MMPRLRTLIGFVACGTLGWAGAVSADAVSDWNTIAVNAVNAAGTRPGATPGLDLATVQAAVYDAVQAIEGRFQPYHVTIHDAHGSPAAATAAAAHDVLVNRFPSQAASLDTTYQNYLIQHSLVGDDGIAVGQQAAAGIIALRANDGSFPASFPPFTGGTDPGEWRPTPSFIGSPPAPPSFAPMAAPWLGAVTPFTIRRGDQFRFGPPPSLKSHRYTELYNEVKMLGARFNSTRTPEQTELAYFWALNYFLAWNKTVGDIAAAQGLDIAESARLFALVDLAMADAGITAWDGKLHFNFWRPLTAIREGDNDTNGSTVGDPTWEPLINTPNYSDHTSGANNVTGAATEALALFFHTDQMTFSVTTTNPLATQPTRIYNRFSDAAADVVEARILEGIHFRTADEQGRKQGRHVARWAFSHFFRPVH